MKEYLITYDAIRHDGIPIERNVRLVVAAMSAIEAQKELEKVEHLSNSGMKCHNVLLDIKVI